MNAHLTMLTLLACSQEETDIIDSVIEALSEYKEDLVIGNKEATKPMAQVGLLMIKWKNGEKDPFEAMKDLEQEEKVLRTAKDMHSMIYEDPENSN